MIIVSIAAGLVGITAAATAGMAGYIGYNLNKSISKKYGK